MSRIARSTIYLFATIYATVWRVSHVLATEVNLQYPSFAESETPASFVRNLYEYALWISGTLAVIMIVYGGIKYVASAGNTSMQSDARDIIKNAVYGILLLGGAYLILNTINPEITKLKDLNIESIPATGGITDEQRQCVSEKMDNCRKKLEKCMEINGRGSPLCAERFEICSTNAQKSCYGN